jgi:ABC-type microcin C transport system duplicated ATPase subunit YejF
MALWLISHDLALVSTIADRVAVMQKGKIVEVNQTAALFSSPQHPYTQKLLAALPSFANARQVEQSSASILLQVKDFKVYYPIRQGIFKRIVDYVRAVDNIHFTVSRGRTLAIVGESGCGKTTLGKALLNLLPIQQGEVWLDQVLLTALSGEALRRQRAAIQMIFQDPFSAMNPRMLVGDIMIEGLKALQPSITKAETQAIIIQLLQQVDLPLEAALRYPHEFSGGQRQRICIARALAVKPKLIVCDEPTSALDVSVQAQIIRLLKQLQQQQGLSYLFISHDLAVVAEIADEIAVMYQGKIVEQQPTVQLLTAPQHPYTQKLLAAVPKLNI